APESPSQAGFDYLFQRSRTMNSPEANRGAAARWDAAHGPQAPKPAPAEAPGSAEAQASVAPDRPLSGRAKKDRERRDRAKAKAAKIAAREAMRAAARGSA